MPFFIIEPADDSEPDRTPSPTPQYDQTIANGQRLPPNEDDHEFRDYEVPPTRKTIGGVLGYLEIRELLQGTIPYETWKVFARAHRNRDIGLLARLVAWCKQLKIHDKEIEKVSKEMYLAAKEQLEINSRRRSEGLPPVDWDNK